MPSRTSKKAAPPVRFILDPKLDSYAYRCWPDGCPRDRTCCVGLAVEVSRREVRAIDSMMDELARLVPTLREDGGYASVFVDEEPPDLLIESDDDGACPFLFRTRKHALCSVHTVALETGRAVPDFKPAACRHWPVMLERDGKDVRVTLQPQSLRIGCVGRGASRPTSERRRPTAREIAELCGRDGPVRARAAGKSGVR